MKTRKTDPDHARLFMITMKCCGIEKFPSEEGKIIILSME
jgi:hypothetical protein